MTHQDGSFDQAGNSSASQAPITIDPRSFFQYASTGADRWNEVVGLTITHCTFGLGTIRKIDGDYIYVDLPERQGKKHLTEFGLDSFQRGFFNNLQINEVLEKKIIAAEAASQELAQLEILAAEAPKAPVKKKRKSTKATKKAKE